MYIDFAFNFYFLPSRTFGPCSHVIHFARMRVFDPVYSLLNVSYYRVYSFKKKSKKLSEKYLERTTLHIVRSSECRRSATRWFGGRKISGVLI